MVFGFISNFRYENGIEPQFLEKFRKTGMLEWSNFKTEDCIAGDHEGMAFELCEIDLRTEDSDGETSTFRGLILHIKLTSRFAGLLVAQQKTDAIDRFFRRLFGTKLSTVPCGVVKVDAAYEFRTDNAAAIPAGLCVESAKVLEWLEQRWHDGKVQIVFHDEDCYVLFASGIENFRLPYTEFGSFVFERDVLPLINKMSVVLRTAHLIQGIGAE
ncbi:hypothetical protein [uncultured Hoeflea sp.]|uniref:hypothetical protein n=1 Tax=uncultured Hoeflea sp. TaxID=538666 RepID=UPI00262D7917|nr:hypothetical protein [uncultured Hoeflea sp.]